MNASFETSKHLAEAGFPKPAPDYGQIWYTHYGSPGSVTNLSKWIDNGEVFAPTATDILRELPGWHLTYATEIGWHVWLDDETDRFFKHKNPAEAAALAWFYEKENPAK